MSKLALSAVLCLLLAQNVFSLNCWVSDARSLATSVVSHNKRNCGDDDNGFIPGQTERPAGVVFKCFKLNVSSVRNVELKGCTARGGCDEMKRILKSVRQMSSAQVTCDECDWDYCN